METNFKKYPIFKKRDGQHFIEVGYIYEETFDLAKKEFAQNMVKDNWNKSNNIVWLDKKEGVDVTGWYNLDSSRLITFENDADGIDYANSDMELFCSEDDIKEGFARWSEDVYTWELREPLDYLEIFDFDDFESQKDNYSYFMEYDTERFFIYNGDFAKIADYENLRNYNSLDSIFMGSPISYVDFITNCLKN